MSSHLNILLNDPAVVDSSTLDAKDTKKTKAKGDGKVGESSTAAKAPPLVSVAAIVGGMSAQKQRRVLDRGVDVLVATPGRLWDILEEVSP